ncbi:calcineurin-like phosphoesterase C-terminal domain-containing protein [Taibaiella koreensis]|uniref:calcineurin-like phosphoesterase C-terminal domain-containing protein n=1 Tax=Taibaiella koreensis TaxID=1268548 RepID=UPI000E599B40|nr:calcineurin-like phosphoesterase family protein [Taibaiella koreensis]
MKRRSFIRNIGLLSAGLGFSAPAVFAGEREEQEDYIFRKISGRISADGKGIANVTVSDGFSVTRTDTKGNYVLEAHYDARFVFLSLPAGYEIPHDQGIAKFYAPLQKGVKQQKADFALTLSAQDDTRHTFVVWADTQIKDEVDAEKLLTISAPDASAHIHTLKDRPVFGIGCGDLVWDNFNLFKDYRKAVHMAGVPFWQVIGNHDMDCEARTDDGSQRSFGEQFGPSYYSFNKGRIHYVVLDDVFFIGAGQRYIGYLTETQLKWLEKDLNYVPEGSTVVVALHIPSNTGDKRRYKKKEDETGGVVINRKALYDLLKPYKVKIVSGHTHWNEVWEEDNLTEHNLGTVCGAWWSGPVCGDGTPNGFGVFDVDGDDISWYYKSTGYEKQHQLRLYKPGSDMERASAVIANIWNHDKQWTVTWFEDGKPRGTMAQYTGYDPAAVALYKGDALPASRKWVEPILTDHLFSAVPAAGVKEIMVRAKDRFGNVYEEKIKLTI